MAEFVNIKLKNGDDLIAIFVNQEDGVLTIENPIQIEVHPEYGFFAKSWLLLARSNFVTLDDSDIIFYDEASDKAISYYEDFVSKLNMHDEKDREENLSVESLLSNTEDLSDHASDLEELFTTLLESKASTKH